MPSGWLVDLNDHDHDRHRLARLDQDATIHPLRVSDVRVAPRPGDVAVRRTNRVLVYRPADGQLHPVRQPAMRWRTYAHVTSGGTLIVAGSSPGHAVWARLDHGRWTRGRWTDGASATGIGGSGDHLAVALGGPTVDGIDSVPVAGLALSDDAGRTWRTVDVPADLDEVLGLAVAEDGTVFVATGSGPLLRVRRSGRVAVVPSVRAIAVAAMGDRLYALSRERMLVSDDHGRSWRPGTLPGR